MTVPPTRPTIRLRGTASVGARLGAVLALNGSDEAELERACLLIAELAERCVLVAVDGGLDTCGRAGRTADLFIGDGDSVRGETGQVESIVFSRDKDFSDLAGALAEVERRGVEVVAVAGLLGGRLDHEWANLLELGSRATRFAGIVAPTGRGTVLISGRGLDVCTVPGQTVSLFALTETATVTLDGARWQLRRRRLAPGSLGLSNVAGTELALTVHRGSVALVLLPSAADQRS